MNKKILIAGMLMVTSLVQAEVLSWRVDIPDASGGNSSYATAQLFTTTTVLNYWGTGTGVGDAVNKYNNDYGVLIADSNVSGNSGTYFYVKLFTSGGSPVGWSALMSWTDLVTSGALVSGSVPDFPTTTPWNAGTSVVPEPTSMALLAMGVSALLMRRKRRI